MLGVCQCNWGFLGVSCSVEANPAVCEFGDDLCASFAVDDIYVYAMIAIVPGTDGYRWGGIGIGSSDGMTDGDFWVVSVDGSNGYVTALDMVAVASGFAPPSSNEVQNLQNVSGWFNSTHEVVSFQRLLDTEDTNDNVIVSLAQGGNGCIRS